MTLTLMVQDSLGPKPTSVRLIELVPATAVSVPTQVPPTTLGVDTTNPAGNVSLKLTPLREKELGFVIVKVKLVEPPTGMLASPNVLLIVGGGSGCWKQ